MAPSPHRRPRAVAALTALASAAVLAGPGALVTGCTSSAYQLDHGITRHLLGPTELQRHQQLVAAGDALWRQRTAPDRVRAALASWRAAVALQDDDWRTYEKMSRAYFFLADQMALKAMGGDYPYDGDHVIDRLAARRVHRNHLLGFRAALRGMAARSPEFEQRLAAGISLEASLSALHKDAAGLLYWYVANLARWAGAEGVGALIQNKGRIQSAMANLYRLDPGAVYRGADRLLGIYYAVAPGFAGGDVRRARAHFQAAIRLAPTYLANQLYAAQYLDRKAGDRAGFARHLRAILTAPPEPPSSTIGPENQLVREKAQRLLGRINRYFHRRR